MMQESEHSPRQVGCEQLKKLRRRGKSCVVLFYRHYNFLCMLSSSNTAWRHLLMYQCSLGPPSTRQLHQHQHQHQTAAAVQFPNLLLLGATYGPELTCAAKNNVYSNC